MNNKTDMTAVIVICSTPYSRRVPEKCFKNIAGKAVLQHMFDRLKRFYMPIVLAIPIEADIHYKQKYLELVQDNIDKNIVLFEGSNSPLHRTADVIKRLFKSIPKYVIRATHDDIILDCETIYKLLDAVIANGASYGCTPRIIEGAGVEIILAETILRQAEKIKTPVEHISYFVKGDNPITVNPRNEIRRNYRLTLDYPNDAVVLEAVLRAVGNDAPVEMICRHIDSNTSILRYNDFPELTIYTCMRNAEQWIYECMASVIYNLKMYKVNYEYIIIDDGSTDNSLTEALKNIQLFGTNNNVSVIINEENKGLASSSNIALSKARGKYILRLDADDILAPHGIRKLLEKIRADDAAIVYPAYVEHIEKKTVRIKKNTIIAGDLHHHAGCAIMNKKVINELKFKEGLKHWDSMELYHRIKSHPELKISYHKEPLFIYRKHEKSMSASGGKERADTLEKILSKYGIHEKPI